MQVHVPKVRVSALKSTAPASVEFVDPETGCEVVLLGCFHGTVSSAQDVQQLVNDQTDIVALELCATRFADLKRDLIRQEEFANQNNSKVEKPWVTRYLSMVAKTGKEKGLATGVAAAVLGGVSGMQTALSGFTPGLEFTTAVQLASSMEDCDLVLADQVVDETLRRLGSLPLVATEMIRNPSQLPVDIKSLGTSLWGDNEFAPHQLHIFKVLFRNSAAIEDFVRLTVPPTLLFQLFLVGLASVFQGVPEAAVAAADGSLSATIMDSSLNLVTDAAAVTSFSFDDMATMTLDLLPHFMASGLIVSLSYLLIALPAARVVLFERDEILTSGIRAACRLAASKHAQEDRDGQQQQQQQQQQRPGRVVAVLGLLHVNGVAQRFLSSPQQPKKDMEKQFF
jgi:pheromone shutdown protein TraB